MNIYQANYELFNLQEIPEDKRTPYQVGKIYELEQIIDYLTGANNE